MKIAIVSGYNTQCGISTYAANLVAFLRPLAQIKVFAEIPAHKNVENTDEVLYCWNRNVHPCIDLLSGIMDYKPDVVIINHEYGYFPKAYQITNLVSWLNWKRVKTLGILHSVYEHHQDKITTEACFRNIMVHTQGAKDCLVKKGLNANGIHVIPHGSLYASDGLLPKLWNHWGSDHVIFSAGFLFRYKGVHVTLEAVARLKEKYPDVQYVLCGSENPLCVAEHDSVYQDLYATAEKLGIVHNIAIHRGFFTEDVILAHARTARVCVLPYDPHPDHDVYATSGIARMILRTSTPLITSTAHLFDDLGTLVTRVNGPDQLATAIAAEFQSTAMDMDTLTKERTDFLAKTWWGNVAERVYSLVSTL